MKMLLSTRGCASSSSLSKRPRRQTLSATAMVNSSGDVYCALAKACAYLRELRLAPARRNSSAVCLCSSFIPRNKSSTAREGSFKGGFHHENKCHHERGQGRLLCGHAYTCGSHTSVLNTRYFLFPACLVRGHCTLPMMRTRRYYSLLLLYAAPTNALACCSHCTAELSMQVGRPRFQQHELGIRNDVLRKVARLRGKSRGKGVPG